MYKAENLKGYSLALFAIAKEENKVKKYLTDAKELLAIFSNPENLPLIHILSSKTLGKKEKDQIIDKVFKTLNNNNILNFLKLIALKNKFKFITNIINLFINYCCENLKIKEGIIYSTALFTTSKIKQIETKISKDLNYKVSLKNLIDKELISGIKIVVGNLVIENSIVSDLEEMKQILKGVK